MTDLTFEEKSNWISLLSILALYGVYFMGVLDGIEETSMTGMAASMLGIIIYLVIVEIVGHIAISIFHKPERTDERDRFVTARAASWGYFVLYSGVVILLGYLIIKGALNEGTSLSISLIDITNLLLFIVVFSEVIHFAARLFFYRYAL